MAETWPGTLPQYINRDGFSYTLSNSSLSSNMSTGYAKRRKRYSGQYATYNVSMNMTLAQLDIFEQFFNNNLGLGVVSVDFPDPLFIDSTVEAKIKSDASMKPYSVQVYGDNEDVVVSFVLERLITGYTPVAITSWPLTLPDCPIYNDYRTEAQSGLVRDTDYDTGVIEDRRRFSAVIRYHFMTMILNRAELEIFFNFYASLGYGSKNFTAPFPPDSTQNIRARFNAEQGYSVKYYGDTELFSVTFIWEELPPLLTWS